LKNQQPILHQLSITRHHEFKIEAKASISGMIAGRYIGDSGGGGAAA